MTSFSLIRLTIAALVPGVAGVLAADPNPAPKKTAPPAEQPAPGAKTPLGEPRGTSEPLGEPEAVRGERKAGRSDKVVQPIDINSADQAALEAHPLIGPIAARAIVTARPFSSLDDLQRIQGLSAERIEQIRIAVDAPALAAESLAPDRIGPKHGKVDVNTADRATLEKLSSVGPELASAIIAARPFKRIDDLDRIQGVSAERREHMRIELVVATPELALGKGEEAPRGAPPKGTRRPDDPSPTGRNEKRR